MKLSRYQLNFTAQEKISFKQFPGSALRGVFGDALKAISCVTQREHCQGCTQKTNCAFPQVFKTTKLEKQRLTQVPQPLILDASEVPNKINRGESFTLYLTLIGASQQYIDQIIQAWVFAEQLGLDSESKKSTFQLLSVEIVDTSLPEKLFQSNLFLIDLITPHRAFRREGHKRRRQLITPETFIVNTYFANIVRRYLSLEELYGKNLSDEKAEILMNASYALEPIKQTLKLAKYHRISRIQNKALDLSGLKGEIIIRSNDLSTLLPILWLGQWLHVGNNTMSGLGSYRLIGESNA